MKRPIGFDPVAWARYNEWFSGAGNSVIAAEEYSDVKGSDAGRVRTDQQRARDRRRDLGSVSEVAASTTLEPDKGRT